MQPIRMKAKIFAFVIFFISLTALTLKSATALDAKLEKEMIKLFYQEEYTKLFKQLYYNREFMSDAEYFVLVGELLTYLDLEFSAFRCFKQALEYEPSNSYYLTRIAETGLSLKMQGFPIPGNFQNDSLIIYYKKAVDNNDENYYNSLSSMCDFFKIIGKYNQLDSCVCQVARLNDSNIERYYFLALEYKTAARYDEAIFYAEKILQQDKDNTLAKAILAGIYISYGYDKTALSYLNALPTKIEDSSPFRKGFEDYYTGTTTIKAMWQKYYQLIEDKDKAKKMENKIEILDNKLKDKKEKELKLLAEELKKIYKSNSSETLIFDIYYNVLINLEQYDKAIAILKEYFEKNQNCHTLIDLIFQLPPVWLTVKYKESVHGYIEEANTNYYELLIEKLEKIVPIIELHNRYPDDRKITFLYALKLINSNDKDSGIKILKNLSETIGGFQAESMYLYAINSNKNNIELAKYFTESLLIDSHHLLSHLAYRLFERNRSPNVYLYLPRELNLRKYSEFANIWRLKFYENQIIEKNIKINDKIELLTDIADYYFTKKKYYLKAKEFYQQIYNVDSSSAKSQQILRRIKYIDKNIDTVDCNFINKKINFKNQYLDIYLPDFTAWNTDSIFVSDRLKKVRFSPLAVDSIQYIKNIDIEIYNHTLGNIFVKDAGMFFVINRAPFSHNDIISRLWGLLPIYSFFTTIGTDSLTALAFEDYENVDSIILCYFTYLNKKMVLLKLTVDGKFYYTLGGKNLISKMLSLIEFNPASLNFQSYLNMAIEEFSNNNIKESIHAFEKLLEVVPNHSYSLLNLADLYKEINEIHKANYYLDKCSNTEPINGYVIKARTRKIY